MLLTSKGGRHLFFHRKTILVCLFCVCVGGGGRGYSGNLVDILNFEHFSLSVLKCRLSGLEFKISKMGRF